MSYWACLYNDLILFSLADALTDLLFCRLVFDYYMSWGVSASVCLVFCMHFVPW